MDDEDLAINIELLEAEKPEYNNWIHFALTVVTLGWWGVVWIINAMIISNDHRSIDRKIQILTRVREEKG